MQLIIRDLIYRSPLYEFVQPFVARIKMQTHGGLFVSGAKLRRNTSRALFNKAL